MLPRPATQVCLWDPKPSGRRLESVTLAKSTLHSLLPPDFASCSFRVCSKVFVPLGVVTVNRLLRGPDGTVIAIVNDRAGHSTKDRFDHVKELGPRWQGCSLHDWESFSRRLTIS